MLLVALTLSAPPDGSVTRRSLDGRVTGMRIIQQTLFVKRRGKAVRAYALPGLKPLPGKHRWPGAEEPVLGMLKTRAGSAKCLARTQLSAVYASDARLVLREGELTLDTALRGVKHVAMSRRWLVVQHEKKLAVFDRTRLRRAWKRVEGPVRASCRPRSEYLSKDGKP
ncbi:MAG: hypothetical protein ACI9WU_001826 [Myxococcota bacterium]|jgi:hypothetical protein